MTREEMDFIGSMNMCDEISNEAYQKIMTHCEEQEPCEDTISRQALKQKLQESRDFFVNAYGGFNNLSLNDKFKVDEITNCIAMVVNEPSVTPQPKIGKWIFHEPFDNGHKNCNECIECTRCHTWLGYNCYAKTPYCPICGARMEVEE